MNKDWDSDKVEREDRAMRYLAEKAMGEGVGEDFFNACVAIGAVIIVIIAVVLAYWL
jgi:hypothetical protein